MSLIDYMKTPKAIYNPYAPAEPVKKTGRSWFKVLRLLFEAVLVLIIIGLITGGDGDTDSAAAPDAGAASTTQEAEDEPEPAAPPAYPYADADDVVGQAGEALVLDDFTVTATALVEGDTSSDGDPSLCTTATLENNSGTSVSFVPFDWELQSPSGLLDYGVDWGSDNLLAGTGYNAPEGITRGDVCFSNHAPEAGEYILLYTPALRLPDYEELSGRGAWVNDR